MTIGAWSEDAILKLLHRKTARMVLRRSGATPGPEVDPEKLVRGDLALCMQPTGGLLWVQLEERRGPRWRGRVQIDEDSGLRGAVAVIHEANVISIPRSTQRVSAQSIAVRTGWKIWTA